MHEVLKRWAEKEQLLVGRTRGRHASFWCEHVYGFAVERLGPERRRDNRHPGLIEEALDLCEP